VECPNQVSAARRQVEALEAEEAPPPLPAAGGGAGSGGNPQPSIVTCDPKP